MYIQAQDLISVFVLLIGIVSTWMSLSRGARKSQLEVDKEQNKKIENIQAQAERHKERISNILEKIDEVRNRQGGYEEKTEKSLKELSKKIEDMPQKIVELLKATKG